MFPIRPRAKFAAVTDMNGPGTRILYRDLRLEGRFTLQMSVFYAGTGPFSSPATLAYDSPEANQQFRIDLVRPSAPIDSVVKEDVLVNVFHTAPGDPARREPTEVSTDVSAWAGQTVRLRLATTDNQGPLRVGVDNIRFERIGRDADDRVELLATPRPASAVDLVLHRLTQADAVAALADHAQQRARADEFAGAVLVARRGKVLFQGAWGRADRKAGVANTPATRFRIGSMNKMFTAVATLQLVEAHKLALEDPIGKHLPDYPNKEVAAKVTVRHLLTHTGGTGDIFGPEFDQHRLKLREHRDYLKLYGSRGLTHQPGARFEYSNYGFVLLGAHRTRQRDAVRRLRGRPRLPPGRHDLHGRAPRIGKRPQASRRLHAPIPWECLGAEYRHPPLARHGSGRRLLDGRRPAALRPGIALREAALGGDPCRGDPPPPSSSTDMALTSRDKGHCAATGTAAARPA
jgi:Beta-lactamase